MNSLFDTSNSKEIIERLHALSPETKALWGSMSVGQMLAHLQVPLQTAMGEAKPQRSFIGKILGSITKKKLLGEQPFEKNLPTDKAFIIKDERVFEDEQAKVLALVERFTHGGPTVLTKNPHPFFGYLTVQEWDSLMWKHLDHHLRQFGV